MRTTPRAVVTDGEERSVLATCRGLQASGYEVTVLVSDRLAVSRWSRSCARALLAPSATQDARAFIDALEATVKRDVHDVLIPGTDASLVAISRARDRLEPYAKMGLPGDDAVWRCIDKRLFPSAARAVRLGAPTTICCESTEEGLHAASAIGFPVLVKPSRSVSISNGGFTVHGSAVADAPATLARIATELGAPFIVQRLEPFGLTCSFAGVAAEDGLLAYLFSKYRRTWPPGAGAASFSETAAPSAALVRQVESMVSVVGWRGIFELELLLLPNGRYAAIDFNPRVYGSLALALAAGVNLPAIWCDWLLGRDTTRAPSPRRSVLYRREDTELRNAAAAFRGRGWRSAVEILRPRRNVAHAYYSFRDPLPAAAWAVGLVRTNARRRRRGR